MSKKLHSAAKWAYESWNTGTAEDQNEAFKNLNYLLMEEAEPPDGIVKPLVLISIDQDDLQAVMETADGKDLMSDDEANQFLAYLHEKGWESGINAHDYIWLAIHGYYDDFLKTQKAEATT